LIFDPSCGYGTLQRVIYILQLGEKLCESSRRLLLCFSPFCLTRNHFPPHYAENISESNLPAELIPQYETCEYVLQTIPNQGSPAFLFVIDTCTNHKEELQELADSIQQALNLLPSDSLVGLITFGTNVSVYEMASESIAKSYIFRGNREYTPGRVAELLGCNRRAAPAPGQQPGQPPAGAPGMPQQAHHSNPNALAGPGQEVLERFLLPVSECSFVLESILDDLSRDPWPVPPEKRFARCTGSALSVATSMLHLAVPRRGSRVMLFVAGPTTSGPGASMSLFR
jgi:protein transport protein SEC23